MGYSPVNRFLRAERAGWVAVDRDFSDGHGEGVAGQQSVDEWRANSEDVFYGFGGLYGTDDAGYCAEWSFWDAGGRNPRFVEEAMIAGGRSGVDSHGLTIELSDPCVGVGFCRVMAGSRYQEFRVEVVGGVDHEVVRRKNLRSIISGEPERVEGKFYVRIEVEKPFCR